MLLENKPASILLTFLGYAAMREAGKSNYDAVRWLDDQGCLPQTGDGLKMLWASVNERYPHLAHWLPQYNSDLQLAQERWT